MSVTVKKPDKSLISAGALARIHTCAHFWHLQCFGDATLVTEPDAGAQLRIDAGISHEAEVIAKLKFVQPEYPGGKASVSGLDVRQKQGNDLGLSLRN